MNDMKDERTLTCDGSSCKAFPFELEESAMPHQTFQKISIVRRKMPMGLICSKTLCCSKTIKQTTGRLTYKK